MTAQLKHMAKPTRTLTIDGVDYTLHPISLRQFIDLLDRYPEFTRLLNAKPTMAEVALKMPIVVPALIAASLRQYDDETIAAAEEMGVQTQVEFLDKIAEMSIKDGVRPLIDMLTRVVVGRAMGNGVDPTLDSANPSASPGNSPPTYSS
jgi:hypothetical protein